MSTVDLTDTTIVETTWLLANIEYYRAMLDGVQTEAVRCGYHFTKGNDAPRFPQQLPEAFSALLQRAILRARRRFLEPLTSDDCLERRLDDEHNSVDGYGQMWMHSICAALWAQGIWLTPGPDAIAQLDIVCREAQEARERRQKEQAESSRAIGDLFDGVGLKENNSTESTPVYTE